MLIVGPLVNTALVAELTEREKQLLDLERTHTRETANKAARVYDVTGLSITRYHQQVQALIVRPEALAYDPLTVNRLLRLRRARRAARPHIRTGL